MYEIDLKGLDALLEEGLKAARYAREHLEELASRKHTYTLYGPYSCFTGACVPTSLIPEKHRQLRKNTRRKSYDEYHLDENYNVIRTIGKYDGHYSVRTYHHFEFEGNIYACPFDTWAGNNIRQDSTTVMFRFHDGKPILFGMIDKSMVTVEFIDYISDTMMNVSSYVYYATAKYNDLHILIDRDAPIDALNSPIVRGERQEEIKYIEFSRWFEQD